MAFVGNRMNRPEGDILFQRTMIRNRDQVDHLALNVHPYHKKQIVPAIHPDFLSNTRYSHNGDAPVLYVIELHSASL